MCNWDGWHLCVEPVRPTGLLVSYPPNQDFINFETSRGHLTPRSLSMEYEAREPCETTAQNTRSEAAMKVCAREVLGSTAGRRCSCQTCGVHSRDGGGVAGHAARVMAFETPFLTFLYTLAA